MLLQVRTHRFLLIACLLFSSPLFSLPTAEAQFSLTKNGEALCKIVVDAEGAKGAGMTTLQDAAQWLAESLKKSSGATIEVVNEIPESACVIIARADAYPEVAAKAGLKSKAYDAFCIVSTPQKLYLLGNSEAAAQHAVATLLRELGFRWFAPSPQWHLVPKLSEIVINTQLVEEPKLLHRNIWYAYAGGEKELMADYQRWAIANRLSVKSVVNTGHSYAHIVGRNKEAFENHPEYFALLPDGKRDNERAIAARKFCFSNQGLIDLVVADRIKLLEEYRRINPAVFMVSMDPSDGEGTCHCEHCEKLGTTTDRVMHLANHVARGLRKKAPDAWVGLYAYSSHRLPPTINVEPNVYVQVAMGFNHTQYTLPELVGHWSEKVGAIGLREYYGVEAWDWGLPGRMRGSHVDYHKKWIPYYADRKLNAINAETNANWGGQMLGLYVAAQLMWNPESDVDALVQEFYDGCYGKQAEPMKRLYAKFDEGPPIHAATLLPMFEDVLDAYEKSLKGAKANPDKFTEQQGRLVDMMAYLVYVAKFREFSLVRDARPSRDDEYYTALKPLMEYAWRIRMRDMVHWYALARRLCNGLPLQDNRPDFYLANKEKDPVWKHGDQLNDQEILNLFHEYRETLKSDGNPVVSFSRYFERVRPEGADDGPTKLLSKSAPPNETDGVASFRSRLTGYLIPGGKQRVQFGIAPTSRSAEFTVYLRGQTTLFQQTFKKSEEFQSIEFELPKANEYRVEIVGGAKLQVPPETPFVFEASVAKPAWIEYSGPHYFYVPSGTKEIYLDANPRLSLFIPGQPERVNIAPSSRVEGKDFAVIKVPSEAAGKVWHTSSQTRGKVSFMNIPPLMSFHRQSIFVPREVGEADGLTTKAD